MGLKKQDAILLSRFLIETVKDRHCAKEIVYNEHTKATQGEVLNGLKDLIGPYKVFESGDGKETTYSISEQQM